MKRKKNKVVFIIPYYGTLPEYYYNWRYTALLNEDFDFLFVTDIPEIQGEKNIHRIHMSFLELQNMVQNKFDFPVHLDTPYKLCDFKPAYGYIFAEYIKEYEFWGHCDIDILMGDLSRFITEDILSNYDKILEHGHMTLYRNSIEQNLAFMSEGPYPEIGYREVLASSESYWFDEFFGMMLKSRRLQMKSYLNPEILVDLNPAKLPFESVLTEHGELMVEWRQGRMYVISLRDGDRWEVAYVHFQKRDMTYMKNLFQIADQPIYISPDRILNRRVRYKPSRWKLVRYDFMVKYNHVLDFLKRYHAVRDKYTGIFDYYQSRQVLKERKRMADEIIAEHV